MFRNVVETLKHVIPMQHSLNNEELYQVYQECNKCFVPHPPGTWLSAYGNDVSSLYIGGEWCFEVKAIAS